MHNVTPRRGRTGAQTAGRALLLLEYIAEQHEPVSAAQMARDLELEPSAVHRSLAELEGRGFVLRDAGSTSYVIGTGFLRLAATVLGRLDLPGIARSTLEVIAAHTRETVSLHRASGLERVAIDVVPGTHEISRFVPIGETTSIHAGPSGKAIVAFQRAHEVSEVLRAAADAGVDVADLEKELTEIRRNGYAASIGDRTRGVGGLSIPVFGPSGVEASVTISGPSQRWDMNAMHRAATAVVPLVAGISERLGGGQWLDGSHWPGGGEWLTAEADSVPDLRATGTRGVS